ncbi:MAG: hypothetical protein H7Y33_06205 [Cytophagales bacterium]|nr:hypothetical protein [Rhizobacter sp.]
MTLVRNSCIALALAACLTGYAAAQAAPVAPPAKAAKPDPVELIKKITGKDAETLNAFLADQGAANISAAALAGVGASSLVVVEDSKDFAVLLSPFSKDSKGGAFAISPAKVRNPLPRIDLMTQYVQNVGWRVLAGLNISGAQGKSDIGSTNFRRRAFAISTSAYLYADEDDPIILRARAGLKEDRGDGKGPQLIPGSCLDKYFTKLDAIKSGQPGDIGPGPETGPEGEKLAVDAAYKTCIQKIETLAKNKWFAPRWSLALGTGDAQPSVGGTSVRTGDVVAASFTYGRPWATSGAGKAADGSVTEEKVYSAWAITVAARSTHNEPVLKSLETGPVVTQNSSLVIGRLTAGTESWRLLAEASNNKVKQAAAGERTMKRALGLDYRVAKDSWLSLRYGKRLKTTGSDDETAALLSLTLGGDLLTF